MLKKDSGQVKLLGGDPFRDCVELHKRLAYIPSEINPWPDLSGGEVIDLLSRMRGKTDSKRRAELIEMFQFDPSKKCRSYSKGNRQKVALIAALVSDVELYIFDEPTSGLDPLMESVFQDYVKEMVAQGKTVFLSSHILAEVEKLCDRVTIIKEGRIVESGSLQVLQQFSRLIVHVECAKSVEGIQLSGVHGLLSKGNKASFSVDATALNATLKKLTEYEVVSLHCAPPENLRISFCTIMPKVAKRNETKRLYSHRQIAENLSSEQQSDNNAENLSSEQQSDNNIVHFPSVSVCLCGSGFQYGSITNT